jgi:hypothetical protein
VLLDSAHPADCALPLVRETISTYPSLARLREQGRSAGTTDRHNMDKPSWRQTLRSSIKRLYWRDVVTYAGVVTIYVGALVLMILLPIKLVRGGPGDNSGGDPNVVSNNNYLPDTCPIYIVLANGHGLPLSDGPLKLPFQRPSTECRTFSSPAMEKLIANITSRMVDKDLARLFENAYPNTLGIAKFSELPPFANQRHDGILVQSRQLKPTVIRYNRRHSSPLASRCISPIRALPPIITLRRGSPDLIPRTHKS